MSQAGFGCISAPVFRIKPVMENPAVTLPNWVIAIYYILALVMWTPVGRVSKHIFPPKNSSFFFMKFFVRSTNPLIPVFRLITPGFSIQLLVPRHAIFLDGGRGFGGDLSNSHSDALSANV